VLIESQRRLIREPHHQVKVIRRHAVVKSLRQISKNNSDRTVPAAGKPFDIDVLRDVAKEIVHQPSVVGTAEDRDDDQQNLWRGAVVK